MDFIGLRLPKIRGTFSGGPHKGMIIFGGAYRVRPSYGSFHIMDAVKNGLLLVVPIIRRISCLSIYRDPSCLQYSYAPWLQQII